MIAGTKYWLARIPPSKPIREPLPTADGQMGVQRFEVREHRDRHEEVPPRIADEALDLALVVAPAWAAKPIREQVVRLELAEPPLPWPLPVADTAG